MKKRILPFLKHCLSDDNLEKMLSTLFELKSEKPQESVDPEPKEIPKRSGYYWGNKQQKTQKKPKKKLFYNSLPEDVSVVLEEFDSEYYLDQNPDVAEKGLSPVIHYLLQGWKEGRNPSPFFASEYYLNRYPDLRDQELNPFVHYILHGRGEGRSAAPTHKKNIPFRLNSHSSNGIGVSDLFLNTSSKKHTAKPPQKIAPESLDIHWIIPDFANGGGGHMTIFRIIQYLEIWGHKNTIWILNPCFHHNETDAYDGIAKHFKSIKAQVKFFTPEEFYKTSGNVLFATTWESAFYVEKATGFNEKFYLVQDLEAYFHEMGTQYLLAEESYKLGLSCLCASPWLAQKVQEKYGAWTRGFSLASDGVYKVQKSKKNKIPVIAVYGRLYSSRRCVELAFIALDILARRGVEFEVAFFGDDNLKLAEAPYRSVSHGVLSPEKLCELYNQSDIGMCFSSTNYSLVPKEMMACNLPVVELDCEGNRAIFPNGVIALANPHPSDIADTLQALIEDPDKRFAQATKATEWIEQFSWEQSAQTVEDALYEKLQIQKVPAQKQSKPKVDIVIPTYNGINELPRVIEGIRKQQTNFEYQIICVDSSSSDGTNEWIREQEDILLKTIDQKDFQHGKTRNYGASLGNAEYIIFLTQDAIPADEFWLYSMIATMDHYEDAVGAFGRHKAYPEHSFFRKKEIEDHFRNFNQYGLQYSKHSDPRRWEAGELSWRQVLHFYSDNHSCMRRKVWKKHPYPEVNFGEDQVWANQMILKGYTKLYVPGSCVYHSHDFNEKETHKRATEETQFFLEHFGYQVGPRTKKELEQMYRCESKMIMSLGQLHGATPAEIKEEQKLLRAKLEGQMEALQSVFTELKGES